MAILVMLGWWYGRGWAWAFKSIGAQLSVIGSVFAVRVLLKTWFAPWKQITSEATFRNFFQALIDNTISRIIGSFIRGTMLFFALLWALLALILGILFVLIWPLLPFSIILLPLLALSGVAL